MTITLINDDCMKILPTIKVNSINLAIVDPPYEFINKSPNGGGFMINSNKKHFQKINSSFGMSFNPEKLLEELQHTLKIFNCYIWTNKNLLKNYIEFAEKNNYKWDILLWLKPNPVPCQNGHYLHDKEYCLYIKESGACFNAKLGYEKYRSFNYYPIGKKETNHPTEKPLSLIRNMIEISTNKDDLVLDPMCGSGTVAVACKELGRNNISIEILPEYFKIAEKRIAQATQELFV